LVKNSFAQISAAFKMLGGHTAAKYFGLWGCKNLGSSSLLTCCLQDCKKKLEKSSPALQIIQSWCLLGGAFSLLLLGFHLCELFHSHFQRQASPLKKHMPGFPCQISDKALRETISSVTFVKGNSARKEALAG